jgi:hypothetical protein
VYLFDDQVFIYEIVFPSLLQSRVWRRVPLSRMKQENRQIALSGGKIITILPSSKKSFDAQSTLAWWIEIITEQPKCFYFFGPFESEDEAKFFQNDYIEDLTLEGVIIISVAIKYCQPHSLTIEEKD